MVCRRSRMDLIANPSLTSLALTHPTSQPIKKPRAGLLTATIISCDVPTQRSVTTQLESALREFLANFVQAGHAEVLAFEQIVLSLAAQFANRIDA